jgi:antitoxin Phd
MNRPARRSLPRRTLALQDAKAQFSSVVEAAIRGEPQHVTRRGKPAVVIVGAEEFERLQRSEKAPRDGFIEHLLAQPKMPKGDRAPKPARLRLRDVDFSS